MTATYLSGLPAFLAYFATAIGLLVAYVLVYTLVTPHREFTLIREGKAAAALAFGGSLLGFVTPLASAIANSVSLVDCALWGVVALVVQILVFLAMRLVLSDLPGRIGRDDIAAGIFVGSTSLAVGVLNAACMTW